MESLFKESKYVSLKEGQKIDIFNDQILANRSLGNIKDHLYPYVMGSQIDELLLTALKEHSNDPHFLTKLVNSIETNNTNNQYFIDSI